MKEINTNEEFECPECGAKLIFEAIQETCLCPLCCAISRGCMCNECNVEDCENTNCQFKKENK